MSKFKVGDLVIVCEGKRVPGLWSHRFGQIHRIEKVLNQDRYVVISQVDECSNILSSDNLKKVSKLAQVLK